MVCYRSFRNTDPPRLVDVWNETFTGRGAVRLRGNSPLESGVFSKPYFDPAGLIVAEEDGVCAGFGHAGFGADASASGLSLRTGAVCLLGVRPAFRGRGIGTSLLTHCENFLRGRGAEVVFAGPHEPFNPYYFGLYGGSGSPGFLASDPAAEPFLSRRGYRVDRRVSVLQRPLQEPLRLVDLRFTALRQQYELGVNTRNTLGCWWRECLFGSAEPLEFYLEEKATGERVARALLWEMEGFTERWGKPALGLFDFMVQADRRRQGLGKFLLAHVLRQVQKEGYFEVLEVQVDEGNEAAAQFFRALGFGQVDLGQVFLRV